MIWPFWQKPHAGTCLVDPCAAAADAASRRRQPFERGDFALHSRDGRSAQDRAAMPSIDQPAQAPHCHETATEKCGPVQTEVIAEKSHIQ
jgi:hypothetical protein